MRRATINFLVDAAGFVAFVLLTTTGILVRYVLPPGSGHATTLWGLDRHAWGDIHFWVAVALLGMLAAHLALHWRWALYMVKGRQSDASGARVALGLVGLVGLLVLAASPLLAPVERTAEPRQALRSHPREPQRTVRQQPRSEQEQAGAEQSIEEKHSAEGQPAHPDPGTDTAAHESVRGSHTLREVEAVTGVPLAHLLQELGLPASTDPDTRIGRLRRSHGISPDDVRRVVNAYGTQAKPTGAAVAPPE